jgi:hypothetical protein
MFSLESISATNLRNVQRYQHTINGAKDAALFHQHFSWNFTAYFMLQPFCWAPYFDTFLPNAVSIKSIKNCLRKSCSALAMKCLWILAPGLLRSRLTLDSQRVDIILQKTINCFNTLKLMLSMANQLK